MHLTEGSGVAAHVGTEDGPQLLVPTLVDEVPVELAQGGGEAVGVVLLVLHPVAVGDEEPVVMGGAEVG